MDSSLICRSGHSSIRARCTRPVDVSSPRYVRHQRHRLASGDSAVPLAPHTSGAPHPAQDRPSPSGPQKAQVAIESTIRLGATSRRLHSVLHTRRLSGRWKLTRSCSRTSKVQRVSGRHIPRRCVPRSPNTTRSSPKQSKGVAARCSNTPGTASLRCSRRPAMPSPPRQTPSERSRHDRTPTWEPCESGWRSTPEKRNPEVMTTSAPR